MNHISKSFTAPDGTAYKSHTWELRGGGYRRLVLLFGYPFWPVEKEKRLLLFLMERGFRVHALELGFGGPDRSHSRLAVLRAAAMAYATAVRGRDDLPLYLVASSFTAALAPALAGLPDLAAAALLSPVLEYPPPGMRMPRCFLSSTAELEVGPDILSGKSELLGELWEGGKRTFRFPKRDIKTLAALSPVDEVAKLGIPVAAFVGEDDPLVPAKLRSTLAEKGVKVFSYPRVRHVPGYDRYADNFYADLGAFLDEVEARSQR